MDWQDLLDRMKAAAENGDQEEAHFRADDLLEAVVERLMVGRPQAEQDALRAILAAYSDVGKWYA